MTAALHKPKDSIDDLPETQQSIVRLLRPCAEATLHTLAWHTRLYQGAGADEAYRAVKRLKDAEIVETEELDEAPNRRGGRRLTVALTRKGALMFNAPGATEPTFRPSFDCTQVRRAMRRQLALFTTDYLAVGWRSASGEAVWPALRAELQRFSDTHEVRTQHVELLSVLLRRQAATVGTWSVVSPEGHVRLVVMAETLSTMRSMLRHLNTDLLAQVSCIMPLEMVVVGPAEAFEKGLVKLARRWAAPPPKRRIRVSAHGINPSVRSSSRQPVAVRVQRHPRYEDLRHPKRGGPLEVSEAVKARQNNATVWAYPVALIMTPEHPLGIREDRLSHSEQRWLRSRDAHRHRPPLPFVFGA